jgi:hypothetical protein
MALAPSASGLTLSGAFARSCVVRPLFCNEWYLEFP